MNIYGVTNFNFNRNEKSRKLRYSPVEWNEFFFPPPFLPSFLSFIRCHFAFFRWKKEERRENSFSFGEEEEEEEEPIQPRQVKFGGTNERDAFVRSRLDDAR